VSGRAVAAVNLAAIERNCAQLVRRSPVLCAVVKANAYGHGAVECSRAALAGGASWLAVAAAAEACELRDAGIDAPILVMGALTRDELERVIAAGADVVAWSEELVGWLEALGACTSSSTPAWAGWGRATAGSRRASPSASPPRRSSISPAR
jgi:alanine racemase